MKFGRLLGAAVLLILLINKIPSSFAQVDLEIKLKNRSFVPQTSGAMRVAGSNGAGRQHVILQFADMPDAATLAQYDIRPLNYIPDNAIMASVPAGFDQRNAPGARWMGQLLAADKISADVGKQLETMAADEQVTLVVEAHPDMDSRTLASLVSGAGGTFDSHPDLPGHLGMVTGGRQVFQQLAIDERIAWITAASDELVSGEAIYYCPGSITEYGPTANYAVNGDGWDGPGLGSAALTYHFLNGTPDIGGAAEEDAVRDALAEWANYADLTFSETETAGLSNSLDILWAAGEHGDGIPFDGPSRVLAHAYFPHNSSLGGDIHFDESESWSLSNHIHLFTVALHEAGHSLGIGHSDVPGSVMYPTYSIAVTELQPDDIASIRSLYSDGGSSVPAPSAPVLNPIANSDGDGSFKVDWPSVANATSYTLQERQDNGFWNTIYKGSGNNWNINGRSQGEYCYRVLSSNANGDGAWSGTQCTTVTKVVEPCYVLTREHTGFGSDLAATPTHSADCPLDQYNAGTVINLSAAPDSGWFVSAWSNTANDASTAVANSISMPAQNHTVVVHYALNASDFHFLPFVLKG